MFTGAHIEITTHIHILAKDCGPLRALANGSMVGDHTTYPHDVSFKCDEGFILSGSKVRSCTSEGTWNGTPAFCEGAKTVSLEILITYQCIQSKGSTLDESFVSTIWI